MFSVDDEIKDGHYCFI